MLTRYPVEDWLTDDAAAGLEYSDFWNDPNKKYTNVVTISILERDFACMEAHLDKTGVADDLNACLNIAERTLGRRLSGRAMDFASGNCWTVPLLFSRTDLATLHVLDYSKPLLTKVAPILLEHRAIPPEKVKLVWGSFYDVRLPDDSLDFVVLAAAFHHAEHPEKLLAEIRRLLKPGGVVLMIGEHIHKPAMVVVKHLVKFFVSRLPRDLQRRVFEREFSVPNLIPTADDIRPPDPLMGDHLYSAAEYRAMFARHGLRVAANFVSPKWPHQSFVLVSEKGAAAR